MAVVEARPALGSSTTSKSSVFDRGNLTVSCIKVETSIAPNPPPKPLFIVTPTLGGTYPVLLFLHGFLIPNTSYSHILQHISSHGYIVVAPQSFLQEESQIIRGMMSGGHRRLSWWSSEVVVVVAGAGSGGGRRSGVVVMVTRLYTLPFCSGPQELEYAAAVTNWLTTGLETVLQNDEVKPNLQQLALAGHSRGGKAAFTLLLGYAETTLNFSALIGIDPVAGSSPRNQIDPKILTSVHNSFNINIPVGVIGTGLGEDKLIPLITPACAPKGVNHKNFFDESKPTCYYFVAKDYGHMDMLDDGFSLAGCMCKSGRGSKSPMRDCVGGLVVAYLEACLGSKNKEDLLAIVKDPSIAPIVLEPVVCKTN